MDIPKAVIRRTQGGCGVAKEVRTDVLGGDVGEMSSRNGDFGGPYRDVPEIGGGQLKLAVTGDDLGLNKLTFGAPPRSSHPHHTASEAKEKGKVDVKQAREGWRSRWKRVLSVPAFKSPLRRITSPVVTRWS